MTPPPPPSAEAHAVFDAHVDTHLRRNYIVNLFYGLFGTTGFRLIMAPTFVPTYVKGLSGSNSVVGLLQLVTAVARTISPVFAVSLAEAPRIKNRVVAMGLAMRTQILVMALAGFFLPDKANLVTFFVAMFLFNWFLGYQNVLYNTTMSKVIPTRVRGTFLGLRNFLGGFTAFYVARTASRLSADLEFRDSYAWTYVVAFVFTLVGIGFFALTREAESPVKHADAPKSVERLRQMYAMTMADVSYRNYIFARLLSTTAHIAWPFYILYAKDRLDLGIAEIGAITSVMFIVQTFADPMWGRIADRIGFRYVFLFGLSAWIIAVVLLLFLEPSILLMQAVFGLLGAGSGGYQIATNNLALEFGTMADRPQRIAVGSMTSEAMRGVAPFCGGLIADAYGYRPVFWISLVCLVIALGVMHVMVEEPRFRRTAVDPPE